LVPLRARNACRARPFRREKYFSIGGQAWNHDFYWRSPTPKVGKPSGALLRAIKEDRAAAE
jgi:superoxide dismutase